MANPLKAPDMFRQWGIAGKAWRLASALNRHLPQRLGNARVSPVAERVPRRAGMSAAAGAGASRRNRVTILAESACLGGIMIRISGHYFSNRSRER
jgi:hypothetical protein